MVQIKPVQCLVGPRCQAIRECELAVARDRFVEQSNCFKQSIFPVRRIVKGVDQLLGLKIKVERFGIPRRPQVDRSFFACGKIGLKLSNNVFGNFTLNRENIRQIAIVMLCPKVCV